MVLVLTFSCSKDDSIRDLEEENKKLDLIGNLKHSESLNVHRGNFARALSIQAKRNPNFMNLLNSLSLNRMGGQYYEKEFFFNLEKDIPRSELGNLTISDYLVSNDLSGRLAETLNYLCKYDPGLAILNVKGETNDFSDVRFFLDDNIDDQDTASQIEYFKNGERHSQSAQEEPSTVSFVIRTSESYFPLQRLQLAKYRSLNQMVADNQVSVLNFSPCTDIDGYIIVFPPDDGDIDDAGGSGGSGGGNECERDLVHGTEHFYRFRARDDFEPWHKGSGEFLFYILFYEGDTPNFNGEELVAEGNYSPYRYTGVSDNNQWVYPDYPIGFWNPSVSGTSMRYIAYEDDFNWSLGLNIEVDVVDFPIPVAGDTITITGNVSFELEIGDNDDYIGEDYVWYCQPLLNDVLPENEEYKLGNDVDFHVIEHDGGLVNCLYQFYRGNYSTGGLIGEVGGCNSINYNLTNHPWPNDEIRSIRIKEAVAGQVIKVYDDSGANTNDDWTEIVILQDIFAANEQDIGTFEGSYSNAFVQVTYHENNGLDGKVSRIIIE